jgi:Mrp family chromosome partitioning ATPase/capsular polysaccharide biosynthesis protein
MDTAHPPQSDISDFARRVRRHWWVVLLAAAAGVSGAVVFTDHEPKVYQSATSVLVEPVGFGQDASVVGGRTKGDLNLDTEAQLVRSTAVATDAGKLLRSGTPPERLADNVEVGVPANTSVLMITYSAGDAKAAQAGSHAFAEAYLRNREDTANADLAGQMSTVDAKLKQLSASLAQINATLAQLRPDSPDRANLDSQRATTVNQINTLSGRLNQLATTTVGAGRIITDADLPRRPSKPNVPLNLASGAMVGLLLGLGLSVLRERFDRKVRRPADLTRRADVAVLATLPPRISPRLNEVFPPFGAGGRVFNRLRNEILASLPAAPDTGGRIVVVTGASRGPASTLVAANLAAAFSRTGSETAVVAAHLADSLLDTAPVTGLLDVAGVPGLSDVLAGRVELDEAIQRPPRHPRLQVVTTGATASAGGLLQSQALRDILTTLRGRAEYIIVDAPSTASSADAQTLAGLADAALLVVERRRTRFAEASDATEQLRRVGTPVLGAVMVPRVPHIVPAAERPALPDEPAPAPLDAPTAADKPSPNGRRRFGDEKTIVMDLSSLDAELAALTDDTP